jgi:hypothetical protein
VSRLFRLSVIATALVIAGLAAGPTVSVWSQDAPAANDPNIAPISRLSQTDQNDDGQVDLTTLESSFAGGTDRVLVFDGGNDMQPSQDWHLATDFENDTWIFDAGADGRAELIVRFERTDESSVQAYVFDDADGDGAVAYYVSTGTNMPVITESGAPTLTITSWPSWTRPGGSLNYNLRILQDGAYLGQEGPPEFLSALRRDGRPDLETIFSDEDGDGVPDYKINRMLMPTPETSGLHRMGFQVNSAHHRPRENGAALFWPLLGRGPLDRTGRYFDTPPTIDMDWSSARVRDAGIVGYPIEQGFHVNAISYLQPGIRNVPNFENAMAYYDLDGDRDGFPELFIRHRYYEAGDRFGENVVPASNQIRYSWSGHNPNGLFWDYKLGLAGRHLIADTVRIGGYDLATVPYEQLPTWIMERTWDLATFVAAEGSGYASSEGIYDWDPIDGNLSSALRIDALASGQQLSVASAPYIRGSSATPPRGRFDAIREGFRGEYAFDYDIRPMLYLSPVDRRVHLLRAEAGIWQVNATSAVRYLDSDHDGWIDAWTYLKVDDQGQLADTRELHVSNGYLVYGDSEQVVLRRATVPPSVYDTIAPANGEQARALRAAVDGLGQPPGAENLRQMQQQFDGVEQRINGARLTDFRPVKDGGFRFVMEVRAGEAMDGGELLDLTGIGPGTYAVTYSHDGAFSVDLLTEPSLSFDAWGETGVSRGLTADTAGQIRVTFSNVGLRDAKGLTLHLDRVSDQGQVTALGEMPVDILAGEPLQVAIPWLPARSGQWTLRFRVDNKERVPVLTDARQIDVQMGAAKDARLLSSNLPSTSSLLPMLGPLFILAVSLGLIFAVTLRSGAAERRSP